MKLDAKTLVSAWNIPWQEIEVLIGGRSSVDLPRMRVKSWDEATAFVKNYGYDPDHMADRRTIHAILVEALHFVDRFLVVDYEGLHIPQEILRVKDVRDLLLLASDIGKPSDLVRLWACAILRVVHTIAHLEGTQRRIGIRLASDQVRARFLPYIRLTADGRMLFGDEKQFIELERIEWKIGKSRESTILKLLHKRANVAETIYDMMGVRIVTKKLCDVMMVIKFLRKFHMITFANCVPGRSRNNLIDVESFKQSARKLRRLLKAGRVDPEQFINLLDQASIHPSNGDEGETNPHSGLNYRSIQLTCRQLIRTKNPNLLWIERLEAFINEQPNHPQFAVLKNLVDSVRLWPGVDRNREVAGFFPFEVQVMDRTAFYASQIGEAAHERYKNSQVVAARRRVLGDILTHLGQ